MPRILGDIPASLSGWRIVEGGVNRVLDPDPMLKFTDQTLYNAHFVSTRFQGDTPSNTALRNYVTDASIQGNITSVVPQSVYHLVPILVLVAVGYLLYRLAGRPSSQARAVLVGVSIVPGYLLLSFAGVLFFDLGYIMSASSPDRRPAILVVGIVYPVVFGVVGSMVGYELESDTWKARAGRLKSKLSG